MSTSHAAPHLYARQSIDKSPIPNKQGVGGCKELKTKYQTLGFLPHHLIGTSVRSKSTPLEYCMSRSQCLCQDAEGPPQPTDMAYHPAATAAACPQCPPALSERKLNDITLSMLNVTCDAASKRAHNMAPKGLTLLTLMACRLQSIVLPKNCRRDSKRWPRLTREFARTPSVIRWAMTTFRMQYDPKPPLTRSFRLACFNNALMMIVSARRDGPKKCTCASCHIVSVRLSHSSFD